MKLELNGKSYAVKEKVDFGYLYMLNERLKKVNSNFVKHTAGIMDGNMLEYIVNAGVMITGKSLDEFNEELDTFIEKGGDFAELSEQVAAIMNYITSSAAFEGFFKAVVKMMEKGQEPTTAEK